MIKNLTENLPYYTQRNNTMYPHGSCNVTSMIQALEASNIPFDCPDGVQPEDYLSQILDTPESWERMKWKYPWAEKNGNSPRHVHGMLDWAVNEKLIGREVVSFFTDVSVRRILFSIIQGRAAVVNGRFTKYGHIVTVVGLKTEQRDVESVSEPADIDLTGVTAVIIDDPYGNFHTRYEDHHGNGIHFTVDQFNWLTKNYNDINNKWCHLFREAVNV